MIMRTFSERGHHQQVKAELRGGEKLLNYTKFYVIS